jgi:hypothetical protein
LQKNDRNRFDGQGFHRILLQGFIVSIILATTKNLPLRRGRLTLVKGTGIEFKDGLPAAEKRAAEGVKPG